MADLTNLLMKATWIDGIAATEDWDSQGESLDLDGADIGQMTERGVFNDNHGQGFEKMLGRITEAKKIFKEADCDNERHKHFFKKNNKKPYLYIKGRLFDDEGHPGAVATAAIINAYDNMEDPIGVQLSVEGKVLKRDDFNKNKLRRSMIRNCAITIVPANNLTRSEKVPDVVFSEKIKKSVIDNLIAWDQKMGSKPGYGAVDYATNLFKSMEKPVDSCNLVKSFNEQHDDIKIFGAGGTGAPILSPYKKLVRINDMSKALTMGYGYGTSAPTSLAGGAALAGPALKGKKKKKKKSDALKSVTFKSDQEKMDFLKLLVRKTSETAIENGLDYDRIVEDALKIFNRETKSGN